MFIGKRTRNLLGEKRSRLMDSCKRLLILLQYGFFAVSVPPYVKELGHWSHHQFHPLPAARRSTALTTGMCTAQTPSNCIPYKTILKLGSTFKTQIKHRSGFLINMHGFSKALPESPQSRPSPSVPSRPPFRPPPPPGRKTSQNPSNQ